MGTTINIKVHVDEDALRHKVENLIDDTTMHRIHQLLYKMCDPYVPMGETGDLSQTAEVTAEGVTYKTPYAHYMYEGIVYGPNIPIIEDGVVVGWFSRPGVQKHPTGKDIEYDISFHPLATHHWDEAMMQDKRDEFIAQVHEILKLRARELYG